MTRPDTAKPAGAVERVVRCPSCSGASVYAASNPNRPFCSPRCRGVDLGAWAFGSYRLAAKPASDDDAEP